MSVDINALTQTLAVNTTSAFAAAQQSVSAFEELPNSASRTFIYTGNCLNENPIKSLMPLGMGKAATAHFIRNAAEVYKDKGFK